MRLIRYIAVVSCLTLVACKSTKNAQKDDQVFSAADYPYIEKFHEGVRLKARGQVTEAIAQFEACLLIKQNDDAVYYALSELYLMKEDLTKSAEYIQKAAQLDPKNSWYTQELAYMYFERGNYAESLKNFEKLVKSEPRNVEWLYGYAECLMKEGKTAEAIKALDRTEEQIGKHPDLTIQKFNLYVQIKQAEKGIQEIEAMRKQFPEDPNLLATLVDYYFQTGQEKKAVEMLEKLTLASPENGRAHLAMADIYRQQKKQKEAYAELKKAFVCEDVDIDTKMKILINFHETSYKIDPEVYELVDLVVQQHPEEAKAHSIRGDYMLRAEKEEEALISYKEAIKYDKKQYPIWNQILIMEYQDAKFEELYQDSKECLEYFPSIATVYLLNGVGAVQTKRFEDAIAILEAGKDLVANDKEMEAEMFGQLGEAYFYQKKNDLGKENYEKALVLDPASSLLRNNYTYRLALAKIDLDHALELIESIVGSGETAHFVDTKGFILFQQGKYADAMTLFENAYKSQPSDKIVVEHMGDAYFKTGNKDKALEFWMKAKELGSTNKNLDKKIEKKEYYDPNY